MKLARIRYIVQSQHGHRFEANDQPSVRRRLPLSHSPGRAVQAPHRSPKPDAGPLTLTTHIVVHLEELALRARWPRRKPSLVRRAATRRSSCPRFNGSKAEAMEGLIVISIAMVACFLSLLVSCAETPTPAPGSPNLQISGDRQELAGAAMTSFMKVRETTLRRHATHRPPTKPTGAAKTGFTRNALLMLSAASPPQTTPVRWILPIRAIPSISAPPPKAVARRPLCNAQRRFTRAHQPTAYLCVVDRRIHPVRIS